jgi:hypothetical protein
VLLPNGSFREWFGSRFGRERALHRPYRSLDRLRKLCFISCYVVGLVRPLGHPRPSLVCWLGAIFNVNKWYDVLLGEALEFLMSTGPIFREVTGKFNLWRSQRWRSSFKSDTIRTLQPLHHCSVGYQPSTT